VTAAAVVGVQEPRISHVPLGADYAFADTALEWLDEIVGFKLDEWQRLVLRTSLGERQSRWAVSEVGLIVPRQNGKGAILEARELVGLFLLGEPLLIHSAHQFKTAQEHFLRISAWIADVPELKSRVRAIRTGAGEQGVILRSGGRLRFLARKGGSGRGFSAPFVVLDEAMDLPEGTVADMVPTQSAQPRRQRWYTGSAVDQFEQENGVVFARVRERGVRGEDPRLAFFEWSLDFDNPDDVDRELMSDDAAIAAANPGYGIRIDREAVEDELNSLAGRTVAVERFGVGDWPPTSTDAVFVIDPAAWDALADDGEDAVIEEPVCLAFDVAPDRSRSAVAVAGRRPDGLPQVEIAEHRSGTGWVVAWLAERVERLQVERVLCAGRNAATLEPLCNQEGFEVEILTAPEEAKACGHLVDLVDAAAVRHLGSDELASSVRGATSRPLDDAWRWDRRSLTVDISPLVAATAALWGVSKYVPELAGEPVIF
jgi:hypothetical protein